MGNEILSGALISFSATLVGIGVGFILLKLQGE